MNYLVRLTIKCAVVVFTEDKTNSNTNSCPATDNVIQKTWVNKWVDYSNRYGFGYQLSNGKICVLFNDGKHISLLPCGK